MAISFQHDQLFQALLPNRTQMRDVLRFEMPLWLGGPLSERLIVSPRLTLLLEKRNNLIKQTAESAL